MDDEDSETSMVHDCSVCPAIGSGSSAIDNGNVQSNISNLVERTCIFVVSLTQDCTLDLAEDNQQQEVGSKTTLAGNLPISVSQSSRGNGVSGYILLVRSSSTS